MPATPAPPEQAVIPVRAIWYAVLGLALGELVGGVLGGIAYAFTGQARSAAVTVLGEIGLWIGMLGSAVYVSRRYGTRSLSRDFTLRIRLSDLGPGLLVAVVGTVLSAVASAAFSGTRFAGTNTQIITGQRHNSASIAVITVIIAVGAPFFEELFFRGLIRTALASRFGPTGAIIGQGLLFGLAHYVPSNGLGNVSIIVTIAALGIVLGYAAQRTGRLGAGMIGHGLFNLVAAILVVTGQ
ncbi:MAG: CPBP family intramembrane metalloprotease [Acidimicrobiaceae bacterium]|nr:CPBP family intramembrane metalloprotease [Acidimicrobiaceae bacterium]